MSDPDAQDALGNMTSINGDLMRLIDARGKQRTWSYDTRRRMVAMTDSLGATTHFEYDNVGNVVKVTRKDGSQITMTYDEANRLQPRNLPALRNGVPADTVTYEYDLCTPPRGARVPRLP